MELGVVMPFLGLLAVGIVNFGVAFGDKQVITEAARYGARRAAVEGAPVCMGSSSSQFERCTRILIEEDIKKFVGIRPAKGTESAVTLASYYTCHSIAQSGLLAFTWKVKSEVNYDATVPTVTVTVKRADPIRLFEAFMKGMARPGASATFVSQQTCGAQAEGNRGRS